MMPASREMSETKYVAVGDADVAYRVSVTVRSTFSTSTVGQSRRPHSADQLMVSSWMVWRRSAV